MKTSEKSKARRGRPAKAPTDAEARQKLIRAGLAFLTERGYASAGVNDIIAEAGVPKGCFYHYFKNKEDFGDQLIEAYQSYFSTKLESSFQNESLPPLQRLQAFVDDATKGIAKHDFKRGCLVGNLGQEMGILPERFRERLQSIFEDWQSRTARCLASAQAEGEIDSEQDPHELAAFFWIGWEGAVLRAKLARSAAPLTLFAKVFFSTLNQHPRRKQRGI